MAELRINPIVVEDLQSIKNFISEDNQEAALNTIQEIYSRFENIKQFPLIGADLSKRVSFRTDLKYIIWESYIIVYRIKEKGKIVEVYRVLNQYQDITMIFG